MRKEKLSQSPARPSQLKDDPNKSMLPPQFKLDASTIQAKMGEAQEKAGAGSASALPDQVRGKMENGIGADFSDVKVYPNSEKAVAAGALAYTQGTEMHFAPGQFKPESQSGQELIGHELAHVKQQKEGRVQANGQVGGMPLNDDRRLESEADQIGKSAAEGKSSGAPVQQKSAAGSGKGAVQRFKMEAGDIAKYPKFAQFLMAEMPKCINDARLVRYLSLYGTNQGSTARDISKELQFGEGPLIKPWSLSANKVSFQSNRGSEVIRLSRQDITNYEKNSDYNARFHEMVLEANIMNGYTHFLDDQDGMDVWGNEGKKVEQKTYGGDINSIADAKKSSYANFGEGNWELSVESTGSGKAQRIKVWNSTDKDGNYDVTPGFKLNISPRKNVKWNFMVESNSGDVQDKKAWKRANIIKTQDGKDSFTVRSEDGADKDRNDVVVKVRKTT